MSREQSLQALAIANERRCATAAYKREVRALTMRDGLREIRRALIDGEPRVQNLNGVQLICCVDHMGEAKAARIMDAAGVRHNRRISKYTVRQRASLAAVLATATQRHKVRRGPVRGGRILSYR